MRRLWDDLFAMLKAPFVGNLDVLHLFFLVGVVLIFAMIWAVVLHYVRLTAMES